MDEEWPEHPSREGRIFGRGSTCYRMRITVRLPSNTASRVIAPVGFKGFEAAGKEDGILEYGFFYGARRNIYLTFDYPCEADGELQVPVRFQRPRPDRDIVLRAGRAAYSVGISPAEFMRNTIRYTIEAAESSSESHIAVLREEG